MAKGDQFSFYLIKTAIDRTNWSQVLVILVSVLIGMPAPLEPLQILFINLITDSAPAIALVRVKQFYTFLFSISFCPL